MLLLDSQVAIWIVEDDGRIGADARALLQASPAVHVSAATFWELHVKAMLGKLRLPNNLRVRLREEGFMELPVTAEHAEAIQRFPELTKHDPFDRLLVAQASTDGLDLVTADRVLLSLGRDFIVDARV